MTKVALVFDDGFTQSSAQAADILESRGGRGTFAVLVNNDGFMKGATQGDFTFWNELQDRGHHVQPHGYDHASLAKLPLDEAQRRIDLCLDFYRENLKGFDARLVLWHPAYNETTPEVNAFLHTRVHGVRISGSGMNGPEEAAQRIYTCTGKGPDHCDEHFFETLKKAEAGQPEFLLYMLHGLDNEGWGPIHADALKRGLDYIHASETLELSDLPTALAPHLEG